MPAKSRIVSLSAALAGASLAVSVGGTAQADINLELRAAPDAPTPPPLPGTNHMEVTIGDEFSLALYATSDTGNEEYLAAIEAVLEWPAAHIELIGIQSAFMPDLAYEGFPVPGSSGLNETDPPTDGDGLYIAFVSLGSTYAATVDGTLVTFFRFRAIAPGVGLNIDIPPTGGVADRRTVVYSGVTPNEDVTCALTGATVTVNPVPCSPADIAAPFGALNFFDVAEYMDRYTSGDPSADLAAPFGALNFFDVAAYIDSYNVGCP